jgi:hypothetical protein
MRGVLANRHRTADTPNLAAQGQSVSRKTVAEVPLAGLSFDQARTPFKERQGLTFKSTSGNYTGIGLYAAVSYDEGKTWPNRRLIAPEGKTTADINGYLAVTQTRDGRIQLITSKDHYAFNLAWIKVLPPAPKK